MPLSWPVVSHTYFTSIWYWTSWTLLPVTKIISHTNLRNPEGSRVVAHHCKG